jgi:hypothetical protein
MVEITTGGNCARVAKGPTSEDVREELNTIIEQK